MQDFASPVVYTLSKDDSSVAVSVEVAIDSSSISHANIVTFDSFTFNQAQNAHIRTHEASDIIGVIDTVRKKVTLTVSTATYSTSSIFTPTFTLPDGVSSNIANNTAQDFSSSVFYTLTKDQVDNVYEAQVVIDSSSVSAKKPYINSFVLEKSKNSHITEDEDISGLINHETHEIALLVRQATIQNTSNFTPTITTQNGGTVNPDSITERNFETSVFYTLTKEDYSISYKVTVYIAEELPDSIEQTQISAFDFERIYNRAALKNI